MGRAGIMRIRTELIQHGVNEGNDLGRTEMDMLGYGGSDSQKSRKEQERKHGGEARSREVERNRERQEGLDMFIIYLPACKKHGEGCWYGWERGEMKVGQ